jgi:iron complex outermembrane receptor protein
VAVQSATLDNRNNIIAGTFDNVAIRAEHRYDIIDTKFREHVLTLEQTLTDTVKVNALAGWSQSILSSLNDHDLGYQSRQRLPVRFFG